MKWRPILGDSAVRRAWRYIEELDKETYLLEKNFYKERIPNWLGNLIGATLFCHYLFKVSGEKQHRKRANSFVNQASEALGNFPSIDKLHSGFTGLAWLTEHMRGKKNKWPKGEDPNSEIDKYLLSKIRKNLAKEGHLGLYGLADDWIGYGVYALERWPHGQTQLLLKNLVKLLNEKAKRSPEGVAWFTTKQALLPFEANKKNLLSGNYDLGVAHGIPGVIGFLSDVLQINSNDEVTQDLLENSTTWLLAQDNGIHFGFFVPVTSRKSKKGKPRLAWCYGDLGLSVVLLNAAQALKNSDLEKKAMAIAKRAVGMSFSKSIISDPFICHGASGAFHIFNRLYQTTGDPAFLKGALKWSDKTLQMVEKKQEYVFGPFDLVMGKTGVALSLLSGISDVSPSWDRLLLMSHKS